MLSHPSARASSATTSPLYDYNALPCASGEAPRPVLFRLAKSNYYCPYVPEFRNVTHSLSPTMAAVALPCCQAERAVGLMAAICIPSIFVASCPYRAYSSL